MVCDSPAGIERGAQLAMAHADQAVIVTNPEVSSVRDSDRIIGMLDSTTEKAKTGEKMPKHLLLTRYDPARAARGEMLSVDDVLDILSIPLIGIIPESQDVLRSSNLGAPVTWPLPKAHPPARILRLCVVWPEKRWTSRFLRRRKVCLTGSSSGVLHELSRKSFQPQVVCACGA